MAKLTYLVGDALSPVGEGHKFIPHVVNNRHGWGKGFVVALSAKWSKPQLSYKLWLTGFELGKIQLIKVARDITIVNMLAQNGFKSDSNPIPLCYQSLDKCFNALLPSVVTKNGSIHAPRFGAGLAGGEWSKIENMIIKKFINNDVNVTIYDLKK